MRADAIGNIGKGWSRGQQSLRRSQMIRKQPASGRGTPRRRAATARRAARSQPQPGVGVGTNLALADHFYYEEFATPIDG
jgi:hypothetical protein